LAATDLKTTFVNLADQAHGSIVASSPGEAGLVSELNPGDEPIVGIIAVIAI
jgi:hypothetical protein